MPIKHLFTTIGSDLKHEKVTTEHARILRGLSLEKVYNETMVGIFSQLSSAGFFLPTFDDAVLVELSYQWTYEIPINDINNSFVQQRNMLTPANYQEELLKFTGEKIPFHCQ